MSQDTLVSLRKTFLRFKKVAVEYLDMVTLSILSQQELILVVLNKHIDK